ncbi:NUDIX hydrolase [Rhizobium sp.]|uniref:NUDIX hydrolase n=1 Tax=Rhizobium sp. TaxID=391 RepID=UPI00289EC964
MAAGEHLSKRTDRIADFRQYRHAVQSGAMCYSVRQSGVIETLSLSSRDTGRWIIPKGNIDEDERPYKAAKREAFEEAGVVGKIKKLPIGCYSYVKSPSKPVYLVAVFLLRVTDEEDEFREKGQRIRQWLPPSEAAALVADPN